MLKLVLVLVFIVVKVFTSENKYDFTRVSTTQRPDQNQLNNRLTELEIKLDFYTKLNEVNHRLEALELQSTQTQKKLEDENFCNCQRLEAREHENHQIQKKIVPDLSLTKFQFSKSLPKHCQEVKNRGNNDSDIYLIQPDSNSNPFFVMCNMDVRGGGWTHILNRFDGSQNFDLKWNDYSKGFGHLDREFWLGLENLHQLTSNEVNELLVELVDWNGTKAYAHYSAFNIGNKAEGFPLKSLGKFSGDAGDSLSQHIGMKFSTKDKDQDDHTGNCAAYCKGGWWFYSCFRSLLTGKRVGEKEAKENGIHWITFRGLPYSLKETKMMIRPRRVF